MQLASGARCSAVRGSKVATGVPKRGRLFAVAGEAATSASSDCIQLSYPGKRDRADILATKPAEMERLWRGSEGLSGQLYFGDNLGVLSALANDSSVCGKVRLVYIDPPFATQTAFHSRALDHAYEDTTVGADYIEGLRARLILLHRLLASDGSLYLHLDAKMMFYMRVILDEIFGANGFRSCITRKKCNPKNYTRKQYGNVSDFILFYTKSDTWIWNRPVEDWTEQRAREYQYIDPKTGRRFMKVPLHAPGVRNGETGGRWRGKLPPPGKHWQYPPRVLDEMDAQGEIYWSSNGNPRRKVYLDASAGIGVQDIWLDFRDAHNQNIRITGYPTEKNPLLLKRIIEASSCPGDLILDCYAGSGTTLVTAEELGRRWIGVDNGAEALRTILHRFSNGTSVMGDFVGIKGKQSTEADLLTPLTTSETLSEHRSRNHTPIRNFELFVECGYEATAEAVVADWAGKKSRGESGRKASKRQGKIGVAKLDQHKRNASFLRATAPLG